MKSAVGLGVCFALMCSMLGAQEVPSVTYRHQGQTDRGKQVTLKGVVTKVEWQDPEVSFYMNVKDEAGRTVNYRFKLGPLSVATKEWTPPLSKDFIKIGNVLTVSGAQTDDVTPTVVPHTVTTQRGFSISG